MIADKLSSLRREAGRLLAATGASAYKSDVLSAYNVERLRDMSEEQLEDLIARLRHMEQNKMHAPLATRKLRSKVLQLCDDLGVKPRGSDWGAVNKLLLNPRIAGKLLYEMTNEELTNCANRLRKMAKKRQQQEEDMLNMARDN